MISPPPYLPGQQHQVQLPDPLLTASERMYKLVCMRLNVPENETLFEFAQCHKSGDTAFLFVVHDGKPLYFEEGYDLFPSDGLITQLRLLRG